MLHFVSFFFHNMFLFLRNSDKSTIQASPETAFNGSVKSLRPLNCLISGPDSNVLSIS